MADCLARSRWLLAVVAMAMIPACRPEEDLRRLLLVSFAGFRGDYLERGGGGATPNFHALMEEGVRVERVEGARAPRWWDGPEPLWLTNQRGGYESAAGMWPGTDEEIRGARPTHFLPRNASVGFEERARALVGWLGADHTARLGLLYWEEPDASGHALGPDDPRQDAVIADVDAKLGFLRRELKRAGLYERLNLVVTGDGGVAPERVVELDAYLSRGDYTWEGKSPVLGILPREGKLEEVFLSLAHAHPSLRVYRKEEVPERLRSRQSHPLMPIVIAAEEGWTVVQNRSDGFTLGNRGNDSSLPRMHPVLLARGPAFRRAYSKASARSVDLYPLLCHALGLTPAPNNGTLANLRDLLSETAPPTTHAPPPTTQAPPPTTHAPPPTTQAPPPTTQAPPPTTQAPPPTTQAPPPTTQAPPPTTQAPPHHAPPPAYAAVLGALLGVALVLGFLLVFLRHVTLRQVPLGTPTTSSHPEIFRPLLQDHLEI